MTTVAIDFDGPIHAYTRGWQDGSIYDDPVPGAWRAIAQIQRQHAVFIFTSRNPVQVADWMRQHSPFQVALDAQSTGSFWNDRNVILVTNRKLPAVAYIDDRAIRFIDWSSAYDELKREIP